MTRGTSSRIPSGNVSTKGGPPIQSTKFALNRIAAGRGNARLNRLHVKHLAVLLDGTWKTQSGRDKSFITQPWIKRSHVELDRFAYGWAERNVRVKIA